MVKGINFLKYIFEVLYVIKKSKIHVIFVKGHPYFIFEHVRNEKYKGFSI